MSPGAGTPAVADAVDELSSAGSDGLTVRQHWAKVLRSGGRDSAALYPRALAETYDPGGTFRNALLRRTVWAG